MLTLLAATAAAAPATPYFGLEWRPLSRGDLTWLAEGNTTGLAVGGLDGFARPNLLAFGGAWLTDRVGLQGSLGVARLQNTTYADEVYTQRHWGVVRPELDLRYALLPHRDVRPVPFLIGGVHADIPSARDVSNGYTEEEQEAANGTATVDRIRLAATGGRLGFGVTVHLTGGLDVGAQYAVEYQRSLFIGGDPATVSSWLVGQAALLVQFSWPRIEATEPR